jgi:creatinine amidohydrolase
MSPRRNVPPPPTANLQTTPAKENSDMPRTHKAEEMTPAEFKAAVDEKPVFILTTGILEWHGDHLPLGTDALKMRGLAERLAPEVNAILLPQNWFGVVGFDEMLGTITFSKELVKRTLTEFFENLEKMGAKLIVLLTGHYGPYQVETITEAAAEYRARSRVRIIAQPEYEGVDFSGFPCDPDHADKYETSLMMALHPHLVQMDRYHARLDIPYDYAPRENPWGFVSPRGEWRFSDDLLTTASAQLGERLIAAIISHLCSRIEHEMAEIRSLG